MTVVETNALLITIGFIHLIFLVLYACLSVSMREYWLYVQQGTQDWQARRVTLTLSMALLPGSGQARFGMAGFLVFWCGVTIGFAYTIYAYMQGTVTPGGTAVFGVSWMLITWSMIFFSIYRRRNDVHTHMQFMGYTKQGSYHYAFTEAGAIERFLDFNTVRKPRTERVNDDARVRRSLMKFTRPKASVTPINRNPPI